MIIFDILFNLLVGVLGGIISGVMVSRVFFIQGEHHQQLRFVEQIINKLGVLSGYFQAVRTVVDYDGELKMQQEMCQKGYKTEEEYYAANKDKKWISKSALLNTFLVEIKEITNASKEEIYNARIVDKQLTEILTLIMVHLSEIDRIKDFSFSQLYELQKKQEEIVNRYEVYRQISGKQLIKLILKDKTMLVLYVLVGIIIVGVIVTHQLSL